MHERIHAVMVMHRLWKMISSLVVTLVFILGFMSVYEGIIYASDFAKYGDFVYYMLDDENIEIFNYTGTDTELVIPKEIDGYSVKSIGDLAFQSCTKLTSIEIPNSVTSIGDTAFLGCSSLSEVNVNDKNECFMDENGVLFDKNKTELILYPLGKDDTKYCIPNSVIRISSNAFYGCRKLISIEIPCSVTTIENFAFHGCTGFTSIEIPNSVISIGNSAFQACTKLTSIEIPNSVTSIGDEAFRLCINLASVEIPCSVTSIGRSAFECADFGVLKSNLSHVFYYGSEEQWNNISIGEQNDTLVSVMRHYNITEKSYEIGNYINATCTEQGTFDVYCYICDDVFKIKKDDPLGHKEAIDTAVEPTETETGLTEGKHCSVCGEVLVKQEVIPVKYSEGYYYGDISGDGIVNANDALDILNHVAKLETIEGELPSILADINEDGNINASDALEALKVAAKLSDVKEYYHFPNEEVALFNVDYLAEAIKSFNLF